MALGLTEMLPLADLQKALTAPFAQAFSADLEEAYRHVDGLCLQLCLRAAAALDLPRPCPETLPELIARTRLAPEAAYLARAILDILCEEGFAQTTESGIQRAAPCPPDDSERLQRAARIACPSALPIFDLIARCHDHVVPFLLGERTGLAAIFAQGDLGLWERLHSVDRVMSIYADFIPPALSVLPHARILEVGGGVGAVLQRCRTDPSLAFDHYCFSDIGQSFVQAARRRHGQDPRLDFARIDLDRPLTDQGLAPGSFDVVVAVNVLHVTRYLPASLRALRGVLRPGGVLLAGEGSPPGPSRRWRPDVVFGFLRGWWDVATDPAWRPAPGFLAPGQWRDVLGACGFDPVAVLPGEDWFRGPCRGGLIIAGKPA